MLRAMPDWVAIVLRPLVLVALLLAAVYVSRPLARLIPDGRIKRALYARQALIPPAGSPRPWLGIAVLFFGWLAIMGWIAWYLG